MKADLRPHGEDGPEGEELRSFLRQWDVPAPPPGIEEDLRRTFRRRRAKGRPALWLSLAAAAALALLAVWRVRMKDPPGAGPAESAAAVATPAPSEPAAVEPAPPQSAPAGERSAPVAAARPRRPTPLPREAEVIVEAGQGPLLVELGRKLRNVRTVPETSIPALVETSAGPPATIGAGEQADVPAYRGEWETVAGEWPYVHRSRPGR